MSTDLLMPALDPNLPAELSPTIIDGVLRHDLGFDGVVITDALYMDGVTQHYSMNEAGVLAILAGCDMLEGPMTPAQMIGMINALKDRARQRAADPGAHRPLGAAASSSSRCAWASSPCR